MTTRGPRFTVEHVEAAWQVLLRDGDIVRAIPIMADPAPDLRPGPGPGGIVWRTSVAEGGAGLEASWRGTFKILPFTSSRYALFHERASGDWLVLALGCPESLKARAAEHAATSPEQPARAAERAAANPEAPTRAAERAEANPEALPLAAERAAAAPAQAVERAAANPKVLPPDAVLPVEAVNTAAVTAGMSACETERPLAAASAPAAHERPDAYPIARLGFRVLRDDTRRK